MGSCQRIWCLTVLLTMCTLVTTVIAAPTAEAEAEPRRSRDDPQFVVITEDVIPDVENTTQKVIRVNPLELLSRNDPTGSSDSSLYKIQSLLPAHRNYINSNRLRKPRPHKQQPQELAVDQSNSSGDSPIIRHLPDLKTLKPHKLPQKKKQLHFLYNQADLDGNPVSKTMKVHVAPGAYPVYYAVSKSNGRFGKFPIKGFRTQAEFMKYLLKSKLQPIELANRFDS